MSLNEEVLPNENSNPNPEEARVTTTSVPGGDTDPWHMSEFGEYNEYGVFIHGTVPGSDPPRRYTDPRPRNPNSCDELTEARIDPEVLELIASRMQEPPGLEPIGLETHTANVGLGPMCAEPLGKSIEEDPISDAVFDSPQEQEDFSFLNADGSADPTQAQEDINEGPGTSTQISNDEKIRRD